MPGPWDPRCTGGLNPRDAQTQPEDKKKDISYCKALALISRNMDMKIVLFGPSNGAAKCPHPRVQRDRGKRLSMGLAGVLR